MDMQHAMEVAKAWSNTPCGVNPAPVLRQAHNIANAILGKAEQADVHKVTNEAKAQTPLLAEGEHKGQEDGKKESSKKAAIPSMEGEMDYHGFLDGKAPGAARKIREVLEKEGNLFGSSSEGLMSMKKLMESLASDQPLSRYTQQIPKNS